MKSEIIFYIPSESGAAPKIAMNRFLGVPQFMRGILTLEEAGFKEASLLAPITERRQILKAWKQHSKGKNIAIHFIWTPGTHKIESKLFDDILRNKPESITFINSNLLMTKTVLAPWTNISVNKGHHLAAVIDRGLPPIIRILAPDFKQLKKATGKKPVKIETILHDIIKNTTANKASSKWNEPVQLLTRFTPRGVGAKFLTDQIRKNTPMWIARNINKRISLPISVLLAKLRVRPNTITMVNMLIGMAASIGAAGRTYTGLLIGALLFQLASIVDGCDGEVAKLTHRCTKFGQYIDSISDNFALAGFITGLMIHIYRVNNHTPMAFVWGGALLIGFFTLLYIMIKFLKKNTNSASFVTFDTEYLQKLPGTCPKPILIFIKYGKYTLKKDFFTLLFLVLAIFGVLPWMVYISTAAVWIGILLLTYLKSSPTAEIVKTKVQA